MDGCVKVWTIKFWIAYVIHTHPNTPPPPPPQKTQEWSTKEHFKVKTTAASLAQSAAQKENKYLKAYRVRAVAKGGNAGGDKARRVSEQVFFLMCVVFLGWVICIRGGVYMDLGLYVCLVWVICMIWICLRTYSITTHDSRTHTHAITHTYIYNIHNCFTHTQFHTHL